MLPWIANHLRRRTTSGRVIKEIDGLRFVAIFSVWFYHSSEYLTTKALAAHLGDFRHSWLYLGSLHGDYGVPLFFAISGFILALPFAGYALGKKGEPVNLRRYFLRRITRLEPPYVISLAFLAILFVVMEHSKRGPVLPHFVASLFYVHNLVYHQVSSINSVAWSLEVEVQFYILMPLFALFFRIPGRLLRRGAMLAVIVLAVSLQSWLIPNVFVIDLTLAGQIQHFFVGILLADIFLLDWSEQPISEPIWDLLVVAAIVVFFGSHAISPVCYRLALPAVTFMLMFATFRGAFWRRALRITMISLVGGMCYSIYLLHQPIISMIGRRTLGLTFGHSFALNVLVQFPIWAAVTLLICVIFFVLVERPCMDKNWPMKLLRVVRLGFRKETPQPSVAQTSPTASVASRSTPS